ncbi:MAG: hypothetical protein ACRD4Q_07110 [Candidatus Acidiferrales bacterium]
MTVPSARQGVYNRFFAKTLDRVADLAITGEKLEEHITRSDSRQLARRATSRFEDAAALARKQQSAQRRHSDGAAADQLENRRACNVQGL